MNFKQAELDIVAKLQGITDVEAKTMYDTAEEFLKPIGNKTIINVLVFGGDYDTTLSTDPIYQSGTITFEVILRTNKRHSSGLNVMKEVEKRLIGFRPTDCGKLMLRNFRVNEVNLIQTENPFQYSMFFAAKTNVVEYVPDPEVPAVTITQITAESEKFESVVVP